MSGYLHGGGEHPCRPAPQQWLYCSVMHLGCICSGSSLRLATVLPVMQDTHCGRRGCRACFTVAIVDDGRMARGDVRMFWAKVGRGAIPHPLICHAVDTTVVAEELFDVFPGPFVRLELARVLTPLGNLSGVRLTSTRVESSPRQLHRGQRRRFTSTNVESTGRITDIPFPRRVHLHGRGEHRGHSTAQSATLSGSPPRAWRALQRAADRPAHRGFTSTGVESTSRLPDRAPETAVHLHGRGEHATLLPLT